MTAEADLITVMALADEVDTVADSVVDAVEEEDMAVDQVSVVVVVVDTLEEEVVEDEPALEEEEEEEGMVETLISLANGNDDN